MQLVGKTLGRLGPRSRWLILPGVILLAAAGALWWYLTSPGRVVSLTLSALARRDVSALLALGGAEEKRIMNLSPATVGAALRETWWRDPGRLPTARVASKGGRFIDQPRYQLKVRPVGDPRTFDMYLYVYPERGGRWRLCITPLLYGATKVCFGIEGDHAPAWDAVARRAGIRGIMGPDGKTRWNDGTHEQLQSLSHD